MNFFKRTLLIQNGGIVICLFLLLIACKKEITKSNDANYSSNNIIKIDTAKNEITPTVKIKELIDFDTTIWTEITENEHGVVLDLRYATANNFTKEIIYTCPRCFLKKESAVRLLKVQKNLLEKGYRLLLFDCYRPGPAQQKLWDVYPDKRYVALPSKGSMHSRGLAVDLSVCDSLGNPLDMGTDFDFFGREAWPTYKFEDRKINQNRALLRNAMMAAGFNPITSEWWHFNYKSKNNQLMDWYWNCK